MSSTAPIDTIPSELLCEIFLTATAWERLIGDNIPMKRYSQPGVSDYASFLEYLNVSTYGDVPTTVSHVCQYWRYLAIATPPLWSLILLFKKCDFEKNKSWLQRSGDAELDIVLDMAIYHHSRAAIQGDKTAFNVSKAFHQGFSTLDSHLHRCRDLTLGSDRPFWAPSGPSGPLANLKPFVRLTCLQTLYLNGRESLLPHLIDLLDCPEIARVSRLRIEKMIGVGELQLIDLLRAAGNLTTLEMFNVNTKGWHEEVNVIYLPKLTTFTLSTARGGLESIFSALDAPHLQSLSLSGQYFQGTTRDVDIARMSRHVQRTLRSIKTLTLGEIDLGDANHPWMFYFLDSLETLILHMDDLDGKFLESLCIESHQFLPKLKALVCHDIIECADDEIHLEQALRRRKASRMTLPKLVFHISNPSHPSWLWPGSEVYIPTPEDISKFRESVPVVQIFRYRTPHYLWKEMCILGPG